MTTKFLRRYISRIFWFIHTAWKLDWVRYTSTTRKMDPGSFSCLERKQTALHYYALFCTAIYAPLCTTVGRTSEYFCTIHQDLLLLLPCPIPVLITFPSSINKSLFLNLNFLDDVFVSWSWGGLRFSRKMYALYTRAMCVCVNIYANFCIDSMVTLTYTQRITSDSFCASTIYSMQNFTQNLTQTQRPRVL